MNNKKLLKEQQQQQFLFMKLSLCIAFKKRLVNNSTLAKPSI